MDIKKTVSTVTAGILSVALCGSFVSLDAFKNITDVEAVSEMTAIEMVNDMGAGWNLGNTLDCCNITWLTPSKPSDIETAWGNPTTTKNMISTISDYGFKTVRIPVTWYQMTDENGDINDDYLARVKEIVDWCIEEDMYAIVNMHWDDSNASEGGKNWLGTADSNFDSVYSKYTTMWNEIATYFSSTSDKLVFESNNEPSISADSLMKLNQGFVDTVRATGDENSDRLLLIASPEANLDKACASTFSMPTDSANMMAVSVHYYYPSTFCVADKTSTWGYDTTWGTDSDLTTMINNFEKLKSTYVDNGIPVILGEYGVLTNDAKDDASIKKFLNSVASYSKSYDGIMSILWDSGNGGDMQYFDRKELTFFDSEIGEMFAEINGGEPIIAPSLDWVETELETTVDDKGNNLYNIPIGSSTKVKAEVTGTANAGGNGAVGYWDNTTSSWNTIIFNFSTDADGKGYINQLDENDEIVNEGFIEIPAGVDTSSVQILFYSGGYWDADAEKWVTLETSEFSINRALIPGVVSDTTTEPTVTTTTPTPTTTEPIDTTTTTPIDISEPDFENLYGYVFPLFDNGVVSVWDNDGSLGSPVAITGNGDYTLTIEIPADGAAETIQFLALSTTLNSFQQNADEVEIFSDLTFTINSISVDGTEIEYSASDNALDLNDDGATYRMSIYDEWSKRNVQDINPNVVNTSEIVIDFTIGGIVEGSSSGTTTTTEPTTTTTSDTPSDTTTSSTEPSDTTTSTTDPSVTTDGGDTKLGDVNSDGKVNVADLIALRSFILHSLELSDQQQINADVNGDGKKNVADLIKIRSYILHQIDSLE